MFICRFISSIFYLEKHNKQEEILIREDVIKLDEMWQETR